MLPLEYKKQKSLNSNHIYIMSHNKWDFGKINSRGLSIKFKIKVSSIIFDIICLFFIFSTILFFNFII
jgi:hypothetical protein